MTLANQGLFANCPLWLLSWCHCSERLLNLLDIVGWAAGRGRAIRGQDSRAIEPAGPSLRSVETEDSWPHSAEALNSAHGFCNKWNLLKPGAQTNLPFFRLLPSGFLPQEIEKVTLVNTCHHTGVENRPHKNTLWPVNSASLLTLKYVGSGFVCNGHK